MPVFYLTIMNGMAGAVSTLGQAVAAAYGVAKANVKTQTKYRVIGGVQSGPFQNGPDTAAAVRLKAPNT